MLRIPKETIFADDSNITIISDEVKRRNKNCSMADLELGFGERPHVKAF